MLADNVRRIRAEIGEGVTLVAATKTVPAETVAELPACGVTVAGENRVQELLEKYGRADVSWHLIGHLQTNKVKYVIDKVDCIQSVDSVRLMDEIERQAARIGRTMTIFFEVNAGREADKTGVFPEDLQALIDHLPQCPHLSFEGLMAMVPRGTPEENRPFYLQMRELYDTLRKRYHIGTLSMGMSGDYREAVACGANMVRVGTALFGERS